MTEELKPCSCGKVPCLSWTSGRGGYWWTVFCTKCFKESERDHDKQKVIEEWNKE